MPEMHEFMMDGWPPLVFFLIFGALLGIGFYFVAARLGKNKVLWFVLSAIPIVNYVFWTYAMFAIVIGILDRLNALTGQPSASRST